MTRWYIITLDDAPGFAASRAIVEEDGTTVCNPSPMGEKNARLIANAPELLEALIKLVDAIGRMPSNSADGLADQAREVIAQATGDRA